MKKKIFTFGEIMLRISPEDSGERISQAVDFRIEAGGSECNVAVALSRLGEAAAFITLLPENNILSDKIISFLHYHGVDLRYIARKAGRVGVYWTEIGVGPRHYQVLYDREGTAFNQIKITDLDLSEIKKEADWLHISGVTPAISEKTCAASLSLVEKMTDIPLSIDLNFRRKLWQWVREAKNSNIKKIMKKLCRKAKVIMANETDIQNIFGLPIPAEWKDVKRHMKTIKDYLNNFPMAEYLSISIRESISASENNWGGLLFVKNSGQIKVYSGPSVRIASIVDRVGTGDAFAAGIIYAIVNGYSPQKIIDFAVGLGALKHTIRGDASLFNASEVEHLLNTKGSGKIVR